VDDVNRVIAAGGVALVIALAGGACAGSNTDDAVGTPGTTWDVVILSDSTLMGVGEPYAEHVAEANGVEVELHDLWSGSLSAQSLLGRLQRPDSAEARAVRDAEVVVYFGNPMGLEAETNDWACGEGGSDYHVTTCEREGFAAYQEALEQIALQIKALRQGQPTVIRATEFYAPKIAQWRAEGVDDMCRACYVNFIGAIRDAAEAQGVPEARTWDLYNGPEHTDDPVEKGYISADGVHPSPAGAQATADLLDSLGYAPTT
jgi:lysophospholipase L1-like esterase